MRAPTHTHRHHEQEIKGKHGKKSRQQTQHRAPCSCTCQHRLTTASRVFRSSDFSSPPDVVYEASISRGMLGVLGGAFMCAGERETKRQRERECNLGEKEPKGQLSLLFHFQPAGARSKVEPGPGGKTLESVCARTAAHAKRGQGER